MNHTQNMRSKILIFYKNEILIFRYLNTKVLPKYSTALVNDKVQTPLGEKVVFLNEKTLTGRLLTYLRDENAIKYKVQQENRHLVKTEYHTAVKYLLKEALHLDVNSVCLRDIINAIKGLNRSTKFNKNQLLSTLDTVCSNYVKDLTVKQLFYILDAFMDVISNRITDLQFYKFALNHIRNNIHHCDKNELLQMIFYTALDKKVNSFMMKKCLQQLYDKNLESELNLYELCIVCNSSFKTSTKIQSNTLLDKVKSTINDNLKILEDPALFTTFIKSLRHNKYQDEDIINTVTYTILYNKTIDYYSFCAICHIMAFYSDFMYYDQHILKLCVEKGIYLLTVSKNNCNGEIIRLKDIKRFLWAVSHIGYESFNPNWCHDIIVPEILDRIKKREYKCDIESITECILYLWMLDYKPNELFPFALTPTHAQLIRRQKSRCKHRLNLLLSAIQLEDRETFKKLGIKIEGQEYDLNYQIKIRPLLSRVYENLKIVSNGLEINYFETNFQIPHLNVAGITGFKNNVYKVVNIELLDNFNCVKNRENYPNGLMQLKLRILRKFPEPVITIYQNEIETLTEPELQEHLREELEFV